MNKFISISVFALCICLSELVTAQWFPYENLESQNFGEVLFVDANHGWLCGDSLLRTTDGGQTWISCNIDLYQFFFINENTGWGHKFDGAGLSELWKTHDGGITWEMVNDNFPDGFSGSQFFFTDTLNGWNRLLVSPSWGTDSTKIFRTYDGGYTWDLQSNIEGSSTDILMLDTNIGFMTGRWFRLDNNIYTVVKTTDGGNSWLGSLGKSDVDNTEALYFTDSLHGWVVGNFNNDSSNIVHHIAMTSDGGNSWDIHYPIYTTTYSTTYYNICFTDSLNGWVVGSQGKIAHTSDGGINWVLQASTGGYPLYYISMQDQNNGWISADTVMLHTTNGGITGLATIDKIQLQIYPNPSGSVIHLMPDNDVETIEISDLAGKPVIKGKYNGAIDITALPPGIYVLKVMLKKGHLVQKIVKI